MKEYRVVLKRHMEVPWTVGVFSTEEKAFEYSDKLNGMIDENDHVTYYAVEEKETI